MLLLLYTHGTLLNLAQMVPYLLEPYCPDQKFVKKNLDLPSKAPN